MKKKIAFVISFLQLPSESGNDRFFDIASRLNPEKYDIEFIYSSFSHLEKQQRKALQDCLPYKLTVIQEPGYKKNISLKRFYSHYRFAKNIDKYLSDNSEFDILYCSLPSLSTGKVCSQFCKKHHKEFIIDIQDLWPDAFKLVFDHPILEHTIYRYMRGIEHSIYDAADKIVAVSNTYLSAVEIINHHAQSTFAYLGTNYVVQEDQPNVMNKMEDEVWIVYMGTIGKSYNIKLCIEAVKTLYDEGFKNISLHVIGDGPDLIKCRNHSMNIKSPTIYYGRLPYKKMMTVLQRCDIAINPIRKKSVASIINKVGDYAMVGLPVVNLQDCEEYRLLLEKYNAGLNCECDNILKTSEALKQLITNKSLRMTMSNNSKRLAIECFYRETSYKSIIKLIDS